MCFEKKKEWGIGGCCGGGTIVSETIASAPAPLPVEITETAQPAAITEPKAWGGGPTTFGSLMFGKLN